MPHLTEHRRWTGEPLHRGNRTKRAEAPARGPLSRSGAGSGGHRPSSTRQALREALRWLSGQARTQEQGQDQTNQQGAKLCQPDQRTPV